MKVFLILPLLLVSFFQFGQCSVDVDKLGKELKPFMDSIIKKSKLNYGDSCDYSVGLEKQKHEKSLIGMINNLSLKTGIDEDKFAADVLRVTKSMASINGTFCSGYANLECSSKGVCNCTSVDETLGFKMSFKRDGDACLIVRGSICVSPDIVEQSKKINPILRDAPTQEIRCADKSNCVVKSNGKMCTTERMTAEFERYIKKELTPGTDPIAFIISKTKQGICVCKGISLLASMSLLFLSLLFTFIKSGNE